MNELTEKPEQSETKKTTPKPRSKPGRKRSTTKGSKVPPGRGGLRLRAAVNEIVADESKRIAKALVDKAKKGNMTGTRLLVGMTGADKEPPETKKKKKLSKTSLYVRQLYSEPEWTGPWEDEDGKRDASRLPPSDFDLAPDDR